MSRPEVSVVMPFAGAGPAAEAAAQALRSLDISPGDELIMVDNSQTGAVRQANTTGITVLTADGESSPARARNVGATRARNEWILFLDADTRPRDGLLAAFFDGGIDDQVGALAGEIVAAPDRATLAGRYGAARNFLGQGAHHAHPYRPRAAAANLLVRRAVFEQLGGFYEGVRAAEDTDFTWRLQEAGWRLEQRPAAQVEHQYRTTLSELRRQWRGYAAGRAWLARRYDGFEPEPAAGRFLRRVRGRLLAPRASSVASRAAPRTHAPALERGRFVVLDAVLAFEELTGLALSNRPSPASEPGRDAADVVLVAERFPAREDPLVELAETLEHARVEAVGRPVAPDPAVGRRLHIDYLEDDGQAVRLFALVAFGVRHPVRSLRDLLARGSEEPPLRDLAPAVRRLERQPATRIHALGAGRSRDLAERLARLSGRPLDN